MNTTHMTWSRCAAVMALLLLASTARAQSQNAGLPGEWFNSYTTARTLGFGGAYVAVADGSVYKFYLPHDGKFIGSAFAYRPGDEVFVHAEVAGLPLTARVPADEAESLHAMERGAPITLNLRMDAAHLFDSASGVSLA